MRMIVTLITFISILLVSGCASIAGNNTRAVHVSSKPEGANIYVDNQRYGTTPAIVNLPSYIYGGKGITVKKPGYQAQTTMVNTEFQPIALLNVFFWPGFLIDAATGNLVKISQQHLALDYQLERA